MIISVIERLSFVMAKKFYAVKKGRKPGIYTSWDTCKKMVDGYSGAVYKSFVNREDAQAFLGTDGKITSEVCDMAQTGRKESMPVNYAFVDGSFCSATGVYGYGGFLIHDGNKEVLQGNGNDQTMASMRNVAGEILGSMAAVQKALDLGLTELTIYYDYMGIEMWATGAWKRNKEGTIAYYEYIRSVQEQISLSFVKVKGHSGVEGNEEADRLAKEAAGICE
jgi:ribonuclease HI